MGWPTRWTRHVVATVAAAMIGAVALGGDTATEINECAHTIATSSDPVARADAVRKMGRLPGAAVPTRLSDIAREDRDPGLRVEAVAALAGAPDDAAEEEMYQVAASGGTYDVRKAVARAFETRRVAPPRIVTAAFHPKLDPSGRERILDALGRMEDSVAAGYLQQIAETGQAAVREPALRALASHKLAGTLMPDVVANLLTELGTAKKAPDLDLVLTTLEMAGKFGDGRVPALAQLLRARKSPRIDLAIDTALGDIAERDRQKGKVGADGDEGPPVIAKDLIDHAHVCHRGEDLALVRTQIRSDMTQFGQKHVDLRVAIVAYRQATADGKPAAVVILPFTRDPQKVEDWLAAMTTQTVKETGSGMALALEEAYDRLGWRWNAERGVTLYADSEPMRQERAMTAASVHLAADAIRLDVQFIVDSQNREPAPPDLVKLAQAGGGQITVVNPPPTKHLR